MDSNNLIEQTEKNFEIRYKRKKKCNLVISALIVVLGVASLYVTIRINQGLASYRWLTINGTTFTIVGSLVYIVINNIEIAKKTELTMRSVYFLRLSCAVTESVIMIVVIMSYLPSFQFNLGLDSWYQIMVHIVIPPLTVASFVINDSPIGKISLAECLRGSWFITLYAAVIIPMIITGFISGDKIPYPFLDFSKTSAGFVAAVFVFVYGLAVILAKALSELNRKIYWLGFRDLTRSA